MREHFLSFFAGVGLALVGAVLGCGAVDGKEHRESERPDGFPAIKARGSGATVSIEVTDVTYEGFIAKTSDGSSGVGTREGIMSTPATVTVSSSTQWIEVQMLTSYPPRKKRLPKSVLQ